MRQPPGSSTANRPFNPRGVVKTLLPPLKGLNFLVEHVALCEKIAACDQPLSSHGGNGRLLQKLR